MEQFLGELERDQLPFGECDRCARNDMRHRHIPLRPKGLYAEWLDSTDVSVCGPCWLCYTEVVYGKSLWVMYSSLRYPLQVWPAGVALTAVTGPPSLKPLIQFAA